MSKTRKIFATLTMVAMATVVSLTAVSSAQAHHRDSHVGAAILGGVLGGIIGGSIANSRRDTLPPRRVYRRSALQDHIAWCERRYRSYDARSDTYINNRGRERYCNSPYSR